MDHARCVRRAAGDGLGYALVAVVLLASSCGADPAPAAPAAPAAPPHVVPPPDPAPVAGAAAPLPVATAPVDPEPLGSRLAPRPLPIPRLSFGRSASFRVDGERRGWFLRTPDGPQALLTPGYGNGRVYVGGGFGSNSVYGVDARTGRIDWVAAAEDGGPTAAVVTDDEVLFNTESCTLFVVDANTGRLRWKRWLGDPLMSTPAAAGNRVFSGHISDEGGYRMSALDLRTGRPIWTRTISADVMNAPVLDDESLFFTTMDGTVYAMDQATGRSIWRERLRASSAPWLHEDRVHVARRDVVRDGGRTQRVERTVVLAKATGERLGEGEPVDAPFVPSRPDGDGDIPAGWAYEGSRPTIVEGRLYQTIGNEVHARDAATGELLWKRRYTDEARTRPASPPAVAGSQLVFGTRDGVLYGLDIDTGLTTWAYDVGEPIAAQPTVAHGWVYASTTRGGVVGLEVADATLDGWHMWGGNAAHNGPVTGTVPPRDDVERPTEGTLRLGTAPQAGELPGFPLEGTVVRARVRGFVARVSVEQTFRNPYARPVEAVYLFPLPDDAAVDAMELRAGDRVVRGRIRRREEAQREYRAARDRGVLASLLEQERPNLFRQSIANVRPGDAVRVVLRYTQILPYDEGSYRFVFPMVAGPRYTPASAAGEPGGGTDVRQVVLAGGERRDRVRLSIVADLGTELRAVESETHRLDVARPGPSTARVNLGRGGVRPDRDVDVRFTVAGAAPALAVLASPPSAGEEGFLTLAVHPSLSVPDAEVARRELVFVIDTSSSMRGRPIELAKAVVLRALAGARPDDTFRIVRFSDAASELADRPLPATRDNVARATAHVRDLVAHGATEMTRGLAAALDPAADPERIRIVVLLTDGYIGNETDVMREVDRRLGQARLFPFGVGSAVNRYLLTRLAEVGRGDASVVLPSEDAQAAADAFHRRIDRPVLTDIRVDWGGLAVGQVYPRRAPDLFADRPLVLSGRYPRGGAGQVTIRGRVAGRPFEQTVDVSLPDNGEPQQELESLWARTRIRDLMTAMALQPEGALREEVTTLGLAHGLLTQWTAFIAVDEGYRVDPAAGSVRVSQAVTLPDGVDYGGAALNVYRSVAARYATSPMPVASTRDYDMAYARVEREPALEMPAEPREDLGRADVLRVMESRRSALRAAYDRARQRTPSLAGSLQVTLDIGPDGRVLSASITGGTARDPAFEQDVLAVLRGLIFPAPAEGRRSISYPLLFAPP